MPADFTDQEIETAVEKLIRSRIRRPYGALGQRSTGVTFQDFQEQTIAVMTLTPNAPYYVVLLGAERSVANIGDLSDTLEALDDAIQAMGRAITPVTSTTALSNAKVAADALSLAASARGRAFSSIEKAPAFQRLDRNIQQFLTDFSAPNLRRGGQVVRTPQEGRDALPGLVRDLKAQRQILTTKIRSLSQAIQDYEALNLPALLSSGVVQRAAQVIADRTAQMQQLTPETRVSVIREVTLDLLAARTVIRNFGSLRTPTNFVVINGTGGPFADTLHPAVSATLTAAIAGAYPAHADTAGVANQLDFLLDGTFRTVASMGGGFVGRLSGYVPEPFDILASPSLDENDKLELTYNAGGVLTTTTITLTPGTGRTVQQLCTDINAVMAATDIVAEPAIQPLKFQGKVDIAGTDPAAVTFTLTNPFSSWVSIGVKDGDKLRVLEGSNLEQIYQVNVSGVTALTLTCTRLTGAGTTAETNRLIEVGGPTFTLRIKIKDSVAQAALTNRWFIQVSGTDDPIKRRTAASLGFSAGAKSTSRPLDPDTMATALNSASTTAQQDTAKLRVTVSTQPVQISAIPQTNLLARSEPSSPSTLVIYRYRGRGNITVGGLAPSFLLPGAQDQGVQVGDRFVVRASSVAADVGKNGLVTSVAGDVVVGTTGSSISIATNVLIEILPDFTVLGYDISAVIEAGPNAGTYSVTSVGTDNTLGFTLSRGLGVFQDFSGQPVFMVASLVRQYLTFASTDRSLNTSVQIDDGSPANPNSAAFLLFATRPQLSVGTTQWFQLPAQPDQLIEAGDVLELFATQYDQPSDSLTVVSFDSATLLLEVEAPGVAVNAGSFGFTAGSPVPFARIRKTRRDTFDTFAAQATAWLARPQFQDTWLLELDRLTTIVLADPSPSNVTALRLYLVGLYGLLTIAGAQANAMDPANTIEQIVETYTAPVVSEIDVLVESLHSQGADRAVDLLLDAQFQQYFGLTQDGMSYAGQVLASTKQIMQSDLQVRAVRRKELVDRQVTLAEYNDTDFEFDQSDIDNAVVPDSPLPNPASRDGDAF